MGGGGERSREGKGHARRGEVESLVAPRHVEGHARIGLAPVLHKVQRQLVEGPRGRWCGGRVRGGVTSTRRKCGDALLSNSLRQEGL